MISKSSYGLPRRAWIPLAIVAFFAQAGLGGEEDPRDLKILEQLGMPSKIDCRLAPLHAVADYLSDLHGIPFYLDTEALDKAGVNRNLPITSKIEKGQLWEVLRDTLKPHKLSFMIKFHALTITTPEAAKQWQKQNIDSKE